MPQDQWFGLLVKQSEASKLRLFSSPISFTLLTKTHVFIFIYKLTSFLQEVGHTGITSAFFVVAVVPFVGIGVVGVVVIKVFTVDVDDVLEPEFTVVVDVAVTVVVDEGTAVAAIVAEVEVEAMFEVELPLTALEVVPTSEGDAAGGFDSKSCEKDDEEEVGFICASVPVMLTSAAEGCEEDAEFACDGAATPSAAVVTTSSWLEGVDVSSTGDFGSCAF
jgi:hypothetical protein